MGYIIQGVNEDIYIGESNFNIVPVTKIDAAKVFEYENKANNYKKNCIPKILTMKYKWKVVEIEDEVDVYDDDYADEVESVVESSDKINSAYTHIDINDLQSSINDLSDKLSVLKGNREWLLSEESNIDKQISDVLHFIEFQDRISACDGYKLCKALKELRIKRRQVKNELEIINIVNTQTCNTIANGQMNKAIYNVGHKQYAPRVLTELFQSKDVNVLS